MDHREKEILATLLKLANPPPVLYRYRKPNDWTLAEITKHEIFAAQPDDLNDPFECSAPIDFNVASLRRYFVEVFGPTKGLTTDEATKDFDSNPMSWLVEKLRMGVCDTRKDSGIICLSAVPNSIRMWSYYAEAHRGVCLGFDTQAGPFGLTPIAGHFISVVLPVVWSDKICFG